MDLSVNVPNWKKYIARHEHAEIIVDPGIVSFTAELIPEVIPDESDGFLRLALLLRQSNGAWVYLIPGSQPNSDDVLAMSD